jgi:hypothetical protein
MTSAVYITWTFQIGQWGELSSISNYSDCPGDPASVEGSTQGGPANIGRCGGECNNCGCRGCINDQINDCDRRTKNYGGVNIPGLTLRLPIVQITYPVATYTWCAVVNGVRGDTSLLYYGQRQRDDFTPEVVYMNYKAPSNGGEGGCCAIGFDWSLTPHPAADVSITAAPVVYWDNRAKYYDYPRAYRMAHNGVPGSRAVVANGLFTIYDGNNVVLYQWVLANYTLEQLRVLIDATPAFVCDANYGADAWTQNLPAAWFVDQDVNIPPNVGIPPARVDIEYGTPINIGSLTEDFQPGAGAMWRVEGAGAFDGYQVMPVLATNGVVSTHPYWIGNGGIGAEQCYCHGFGAHVFKDANTPQPATWWWTNSQADMTSGGVAATLPMPGCNTKDMNCNIIPPAALPCPGGINVTDWPGWGVYGFYIGCGFPSSFTTGSSFYSYHKYTECDFCCTTSDCCCGDHDEQFNFGDYVSGSWSLTRTCNE